MTARGSRIFLSDKIFKHVLNLFTHYILAYNMILQESAFMKFGCMTGIRVLKGFHCLRTAASGHIVIR